MTIPFREVHGAGNDFVLSPDQDDHLTLDAEAVRALCDRRFGIGGDGVIRAGAPRPGSGADVFMDYVNADGGIAEMCGNGVRTVAKWFADRRGVDTVAVDTRAGVRQVVCHRGDDGLVRTCTVDMGAPVLGEIDRPLTLPDGRVVTVTTLSMGNPHAVLVVDDVDTAPVRTLGPVVERLPDFPDGTNVEFIRALDRRTVRGRIWERGVGETMASGTGGSAMAVAAIVADLAEREVDVHLPGGVLTVRWGETTLTVTGPAVEVGEGTLDLAAVLAGRPRHTPIGAV